MVDQALAFVIAQNPVSSMRQPLSSEKLQKSSSMRHPFVLRNCRKFLQCGSLFSWVSNLPLYSVRCPQPYKSNCYVLPNSYKCSRVFPFIVFMCFCGAGRILLMVQLLLGFIWNKCCWIKESNIKESPKLKCRLL